MEKLYFTNRSDIIHRIILIINVIIVLMTMAKNLPSINSLLLIGYVRNVSNVPLSFSPAVKSVALYIAVNVIAIIVKTIAMFITSLAIIESPFSSTTS